jgi:large subunit ribosomal protein L5e
MFASSLQFLTGALRPGHQLLKEDEPEKFQSHFSGLVKEGIEADDLADMYTKVHAAIRADPAAQLTEKKAPAEKRK